MRPPARPLAALAVAGALTLGGCGTGDAGADGSGGSSGSAGGKAEDRPVTVEIEIEDGQVSPSGKRVNVSVGQPVRLVVDSDVADELHVHSSPEHSFEIEPRDDQEFELTLQQPGVVEAELHDLGDIVVTLAARP